MCFIRVINFLLQNISDFIFVILLELRDSITIIIQLSRCQLRLIKLISSRFCLYHLCCLHHFFLYMKIYDLALPVITPARLSGQHFNRFNNRKYIPHLCVCVCFLCCRLNFNLIIMSHFSFKLTPVPISCWKIRPTRGHKNLFAGTSIMFKIVNSVQNCEQCSKQMKMFKIMNNVQKSIMFKIVNNV